MSKRATGPRLSAASLDLILAANGKKTVDELRNEQQAARQARLAEVQAAEVRPLNAQQRKSLRRVMAKAGLDLLGRPLAEGGAP